MKAYGINDTGQVVGRSDTPGSSDSSDPLQRYGHAFITGPNGVGMTDINSLGLPAGGVLFSAWGINNRGQVIAEGSVGFVPEPSSYAMLVAGLGLLGFIVRGHKTA